MSVPMGRAAVVLLGVLGIAGNVHAKSLAEVAREDAERRAKLAAADKNKTPKTVYDAAALAGAHGANMSQLDGSGMPPVTPALSSLRDLGQPLDTKQRAAAAPTATPPTPQPPVSRAQAAERCIDAPLGAVVTRTSTGVQLLEEAQKNAGKRQRICN